MATTERNDDEVSDVIDRIIKLYDVAFAFIEQDTLDNESRGIICALLQKEIDISKTFLNISCKMLITKKDDDVSISRM